VALPAGQPQTGQPYEALCKWRGSADPGGATATPSSRGIRRLLLKPYGGGIGEHILPSTMSGQGRSTASSRPYPWSPRLTVSGGGQSQYSAYTIYSDVESDHNVFAFVPPPVGGAELPVQPPLPGPLPVLEEIPRPTTAFHLPTSESHRRQVIPSLGRFVRRFTASDVSGTRPATQNTSEERLQSPPTSLGSARRNTTSSEDSDVFNYALPRQDNAIEPPVLVSLNDASGSLDGDPSVPSQFGEKGHDLRCDLVDGLA